MIVKEAINNSIKYSEAGKVSLLIFLSKGMPVIIIKDNGKGFDSANTVEGNGLKNMKARAAQIHYHINISSENGTTIQLQKH
jgi:signal transduction histidine kinase